jgi:phenylpropionate dioxygenase-like ring-hydroxylating dioxygenase large terminal subunit
MSMMQGAPWLLAHRSMLLPDRPMQVALYGQDYVLWQDRQGNISALPNACPHMGAMLSAGWCVDRPDGRSAIVCPFHALEFDASGCTVLPGSQRATQPLLQPLELIIQGDFIWSYGGITPAIPIPNILNDLASRYRFVGAIANISVKTNLITMLLNMHDYNHQNGTHRDLFRIQEVQFKKFIDQGHESHAFYDMPTASAPWLEKLKNPGLMLIPPVIKAHLENHFPALVIFHGQTAFGKIAQCHIFAPESATQTRTYILMFGQSTHPLFKFMGQTALNFAKVVVEQDADILGKIYPDAPQKIRLNNEVGMDWVRRNFASFPTVAEPNLSIRHS